MITVVGEALIDLVIDPAGNVTAVLGGAPFNTARACGLLGVDVEFVGSLSDDRFGGMLARQLADDGVDVSRSPRVELPTTLAAAEIDERGTATYRFYIDGTSAPALDGTPSFEPGDVVFTGGLGLVLEPMAASVDAMLASVPDGVVVVVDVNCRPRVVPDRDAYLARVRRAAAAADVVKVSDEDLAYLAPGADHLDAARELLTLGPTAVLVTAGGDGVHVLTRSAERFVPVVPVEVVDTIGAGDTFGGGLMSWLVLNGPAAQAIEDVDRLERAVRAATVAAGVACTRRGAQPPRIDELPPTWAS